MTLLDKIERHLVENRISATRFGRRAVGDPRFVLDLRKGRRPRRRTLERLSAYLGQFETGDPSSDLRTLCNLSTRDGAYRSAEQLRSTSGSLPLRRSPQAGLSVRR